jgi:hypothetical protein
VDAISKSALAPEKKLELFRYAANNKDLDYRLFALKQLQKLDPQLFMRVLLATLDAMPKKPNEPNGPFWGYPEAAYAHLVLATDDARAWEMLEKVAKRSDVGLRMGFLEPMSYTDLGDQHRKERLKFLAAFLNDTDTHKVQRFGFRNLAVQDLAAMEIASILKMPDHPDISWTPEQWEKLRAQVKKALDG